MISMNPVLVELLFIYFSFTSLLFVTARNSSSLSGQVARLFDELWCPPLPSDRKRFVARRYVGLKNCLFSSHMTSLKLKLQNYRSSWDFTFMVNKRTENNTRAKRLRMRKVSIFKSAVANANFTTRMPVFELKSNFISIQNFKAGNVKPPGMHWSKDF